MVAVGFAINPRNESLKVLAGKSGYHYYLDANKDFVQQQNVFMKNVCAG